MHSQPSKSRLPTPAQYSPEAPVGPPTGTLLPLPDAPIVVVLEEVPDMLEQAASKLMMPAHRKSLAMMLILSTLQSGRLDIRRAGLMFSRSQHGRAALGHV